MPDPAKQSLSEVIAASIVRKINSGKLKPGDRVIEQAIADEFETSRGPVREALKILDARNWIELTPGSGARVAKRESAPQIETALIAGAMLGLAYRFAVIKATDAEITEFCTRASKVIRLLRKSNFAADVLSQAVLEAGYYAVALADNRYVDEVVGPVPKDALSSHAPMGYQDAAARSEAADFWTELAVAFKTRDPVKAEQVGRGMVEAALKRIFRNQLAQGNTTSK